MQERRNKDSEAAIPAVVTGLVIRGEAAATAVATALSACNTVGVEAASAVPTLSADAQEQILSADQDAAAAADAGAQPVSGFASATVDHHSIPSPRGTATEHHV